jgi:hypothetical protein
VLLRRPAYIKYWLGPLTPKIVRLFGDLELELASASEKRIPKQKESMRQGLLRRDGYS